MSKWTVDTLKEHLAALRATDQHALELQADEYSRRLEDLNHAQERAVEDRSEFVTKTDYDHRHEDLVRRTEDLERWRANLTGRAIGIAIIGAVLVAFLSAAVTHIAGI